MVRYKVGAIIWGTVATIFLLVVISTLPTKDASVIIPNGVILGTTIVGTTVNIVKYRKTKSSKENNRQNNTRYVSSTPTPTTMQASNPSFPPQQTAISKQEPSNSNEIMLKKICDRIPKDIVDLLWFSNGSLKNYNPNSKEMSFEFAGNSIRITTSMTKEPSAIDINLPIADTPPFSTSLTYYPSYERLTPQERTVYLNWLTDITTPIDIGYVFIFYYGLERHLLFGNSIEALAVIFILRQFHDNSSFLWYSSNAILLYSLANKRWDILNNVDLDLVPGESRVLISAILNRFLSAEDIISSYKNFGFANNRYIKNEPQLFKSTLENLLINQYESIGFPIYDDDFIKAQKAITLMLANYSLSPEQRELSLPDLTTSPRVYSEVNSLLINTHESVKSRLREQRKKSAQ